MDVVTIYPEEGEFSRIAKALLEAADHPGQVRYVSSPQAGFMVPEEVLARFEASQSSSDGQEASPADTEPVKRKPGRPRKNPEVTQETQTPGKEE